MEFTKRRLARLGQEARSSAETKRPRIGRIALVMSLLLPAALLSPISASASASDGRVVNGNGVGAAEVSASGQWSAVVPIFATDAEGTRLCTGTLIAPNWVATAAHCLALTSDATKAIAPSDVFVASGVTSVAAAGDRLVGAVTTVVHPGFTWANASWDVALIELASTVPATPFALPDPRTPEAYASGPADNVAGFGRTQAANNASSGTLRSGRLEQVNPVSCEEYNPGSSAYADCYLPGAGRAATCFGDSGGPLVRFDATGRPVLWGITSTGPDPCDAATNGSFAPSFETRVSSVFDWINGVRAASTYVPVATGAGGRAAAPAPAAVATPAAVGGTPANKATKAPAAGTGTGAGIGIFRSKLTRAPSKKATGTLTLSASFVGATGVGNVQVERCIKRKCKVVSTSTMAFVDAGRTIQGRVKLPRCTKRATMTLRLKVSDASGAIRDTASQRVVKCK